MLCISALHEWLFFGLVAASVATAFDLPFQDHFDNATSLDNWSVQGSWTVERQRLKGVPTDIKDATAILNTEVANFVFDAEMTVTKGIAEGHSGFIFRAYSTQDGPFFYAFRLWAAGEQLTIQHFNGTEETLISQRGSYSSDQTVKVRITAVDTSIQVFLDDMDYPQLEISDDRIVTGGVGFLVSEGGEAVYDNVRLDLVEMKR
jgi:hypothetical protein